MTRVFAPRLKKSPKITLDILVGLVKTQRLSSQIRKKNGETLFNGKPPRYAERGNRISSRHQAAE